MSRKKSEKTATETQSQAKTQAQAEAEAKTQSATSKRPGMLGPVYALVGATEAAADALRELGSDAEVAAADERGRGLARLRGDVTHIARGTARVPALAVGEVRARYSQLAARGQKTVAGAVSEAMPVAKRVRKEGEARVRAEDARARREARRLARQAGETVDRGREFVTDAGRAAERTLESVRAEADHVVEAVTPVRPARAVRRPAARRRAAVADTAVTATAPAGGESDTAARHERTSGAGVEAAATTTARRSPRARKAAAAANSGGTASPASPAAATTTPGKKSAAKKVSVKPAKKTTVAKATPATAVPAKAAPAKAVATPATPAAPTPAAPVGLPGTPGQSSVTPHGPGEGTPAR